jgi:hypothetical protein
VRGLSAPQIVVHSSRTEIGGSAILVWVGHSYPTLLTCLLKRMSPLRSGTGLARS